MAATAAVLSNHCRYQLMKKALDLLNDSIKICLMRDGFVFDKDFHATWDLCNPNYTSNTLSIDSSLRLADSAGELANLGFSAGMMVNVSGFMDSDNNGPKWIDSIAGDGSTITFADTTGMSEESPASVTVEGTEELAEDHGYTPDTKILENVVLTESDANDRAELTCDDVVWAADGGAIGPTPGAILYDDDSSDNTIIGYLDFSTDRTVQDTQDFVIGAIKILGT